MRKELVLLTASLTLITLGPTIAGDTQRGKLLYENHCRACHESNLHIRKHSAVSSIGDVRFQIDRWQAELGLRWNRQDMDDIFEYLDTRYYHFDQRPRP